LSSQNISTNKPFAVAFVIPNSDIPGVMVTETPGTSFANSFTYDVGSSKWLYYVDSTIATYQYLIRAYVTINATDTSDTTSIVTPKEFYLSQNYPNPFNPSTNIDFTLPQPERVKVLIYNQLGELVAKLVDRDYNEGPHTVNFNAANLSSGIYFYKIEAGSFVQTKKMMLLK
jgi:hypothetical protein